LRGLTRAVHDRDCNALIDSFSAESLAALGLGRGALVTDCEANFQALQQFGGITIDEFKVISVTGPRAVVSTTGRVAGKPLIGEDHFIRQNGNWKVDLLAY